MNGYSFVLSDFQLRNHTLGWNSFFKGGGKRCLQRLESEALFLRLLKFTFQSSWSKHPFWYFLFIWLDIYGCVTDRFIGKLSLIGGRIVNVELMRLKSGKSFCHALTGLLRDSLRWIPCNLLWAQCTPILLVKDVDFENWNNSYSEETGSLVK